MAKKCVQQYPCPTADRSFTARRRSGMRGRPGQSMAARRTKNVNSSTEDSRVVPHRSTNSARPSLASEC